MSNRTRMDVDREEPARSRSGWGFMAGVLVGLTGALAGLALVVAAQRRMRSGPTADDAAARSAQAQDAEELQAQALQAQQDELDEELAQTFPASDPLPQSHRVD